MQARRIGSRACHELLTRATVFNLISYGQIKKVVYTVIWGCLSLYITETIKVTDLCKSSSFNRKLYRRDTSFAKLINYEM
jgi:hypothetical protein